MSETSIAAEPWHYVYQEILPGGWTLVGKYVSQREAEAVLDGLEGHGRGHNGWTGWSVDNGKPSPI